MSEEEIKKSIRGFYDSLMSGDIGKMLTFCKRDITLNWISFAFKGREEIKKWASELRQMFPKLKMKNRELLVNKKRAVHEFTLEVTTRDGRRGWTLGKGVYEFRKGKIQRAWINLARGYILIEGKEVKDLV